MAHRCLEIPEVLLIIARELREESLASVLNLALTHSSMCGPCLEVLWEKQTMLVPILKLFPECEIRDCPGTSEAQDLVRAKILTGPPSRDSWLEAQKYARRVRVLELVKEDGGIYSRFRNRYFTDEEEEDEDENDDSDSEGDGAQDEVEDGDDDGLPENEGDVLGNVAGPDPSGEAEGVDDGLFDERGSAGAGAEADDVVQNLFAPSLREVILSLRLMQEEENFALYEHLPTACPDLKRLSIYTDGPCDIEQSNALRDMILRFNSLTTLGLPDTRLPALVHLGQYDALESLELTLRNNFSLDEDVEPFVFSAPVKHFRINAHDHAPLEVESLHILCEEEAPTCRCDVRENTLELLASGLAPSVIRQLLYYQCSYIDPTWGALPASCLLQFTVYPHLTHLGLDCWIDATDADLEAVARALPLLEHFVLDVTAEGRNGLMQDVRTTLAGLLPFSHHCRDLRVLCLRLDATSVPAIPDASEASAPVAHHVRMHFADSAVADPAAVAGFLARAFPAGCSIARYPPRDGMYDPYHTPLLPVLGDTFDNDAQWNIKKRGSWPIGRWRKVYDELRRLQGSP
uniref:Uncharacterized protein n=1 Tax=Schizophyllum commune (strain H4-8 / FGSC 9210) TaxID=578458 RepID=D8PYK4_SCHCM